MVENNVLKSAYRHSDRNHSLWRDGVQNILTVTGAADVWANPKSKTKHLNLQAKAIQKRLVDITYQNCYAELENSKKHSQYSLLHPIYRTKPQYLDKVKDPRHRTTITKLRTHSHCLQTETGNYTKTKKGNETSNAQIAKAKKTKLSHIFFGNARGKKFKL